MTERMEQTAQSYISIQIKTKLRLIQKRMTFVGRLAVGFQGDLHIEIEIGCQTAVYGVILLTVGA
ncbi:hypothetical protein [Paenibacillus sp. 1P07SE]|uniref:hypothetical protein n=1 Tax=Paenibacillus sp. 1P07SE TaxID=3132209 RepID=UPI0039A4D3CB